MDAENAPPRPSGSAGGPEPAREPTADLVRRFASDVAALAHTYGRDIRDHLRGMGRDLALAAVLVGGALVLGVFALGLAVATLVLILSVWMPGWLAGLVVMGTVVTSMGVMVLAAARRVRRRRAAWAARVSEEVRWLKSLFTRES
jgi:hypothetical protein